MRFRVLGTLPIEMQFEAMFMRVSCMFVQWSRKGINGFVNRRSSVQVRQLAPLRNQGLTHDSGDRCVKLLAESATCMQQCVHGYATALQVFCLRGMAKESPARSLDGHGISEGNSERNAEFHGFKLRLREAPFRFLSD